MKKPEEYDILSLELSFSRFITAAKIMEEQSMKFKHSRTLIIITLILGLLLSSAVCSYGASGTKKMTAYEQVIKSGKYAYCITYDGVYKVNLKTWTKKLIYKSKYRNKLVSNDYLDNYEKGLETNNIDYIKKHKNYIYLFEDGLRRVSTAGKHKKTLDTKAPAMGYAIYKNKIYYITQNDDKPWITHKRQMKLNGKSKKKGPYYAETRTKKTNKKGYRIKTKDKVVSTETYMDRDGFEQKRFVILSTQYLVTPSGKQVELDKRTYKRNE